MKILINMKYLITESQFTNTIKRFIISTLNELKNQCEDYDESQAPGDWYNWDDCDVANLIDRIEIKNIEKQESIKNYYGKKYPRFIVWVNVYYYSIFAAVDTDNVAYVLAERIFEKYKIRLTIRVEENINTNTDRQL